MFNVGGISYGSVAPFLEAYQQIHIGWLWLLWICVLAFAVCTVLLAGQRAWEQMAGDLSDLRKQIRPQLIFHFRSECCGYGHGHHPDYIYVGVSNPGTVTIHNALVRVSLPGVCAHTSLLQWSTYDLAESIQIDPSPSGLHHHAGLAELGHFTSGCKLRMATTDYDHQILDPGQYEVFVSVSGENVTPTVAKALLSLSQDGVIDLQPLPAPGTGGWAHSGA